MLKISESSTEGYATLQLAGRLAGEWVSELKAAYGSARAGYGRVILDCSDVVFVDRAGAALIRSMAREGVSVTNCSPFIKEQLNQSFAEE